MKIGREVEEWPLNVDTVKWCLEDCAGRVEKMLKVLRQTLAKMGELIDALEESQRTKSTKIRSAEIERLRGGIQYIEKRLGIFNGYKLELQAAQEEINKVESKRFFIKDKLRRILKKIADINARVLTSRLDEVTLGQGVRKSASATPEELEKVNEELESFVSLKDVLDEEAQVLLRAKGKKDEEKEAA